MANKEETFLQERIQKLIRQRVGSYIPKKNHGNMITIPGLPDLPFTYKGFSVFWEVKTPEAYLKKGAVSEEQGIHCRLARKAYGLTAIVWSVDIARIILDELDRCDRLGLTPKEMLAMMDILFESRGLDDGTTY